MTYQSRAWPVRHADRQCVPRMRRRISPNRWGRAASIVVRLSIVSLMTMACAARQSMPGEGVALATLERQIIERIAEVPGARVGVAYIDEARGDSLFLHGDTAFHAASTMKVPVLVELYRRQERGELAADGAVLLRNEFRSIVDGSAYSLPLDSDSDSSLYRRLGERVPISELAELMIVRSSNLATNVLIEHLDAGSINRTMVELEAGGMRVLRGVEDGKAYAAGLNNSTTARALGMLFAAIEEGRAVSPASTDAIRATLLRQEFNDEIPSGLPPGTRVAHKTGFITATLHDGAIIYPADRARYVLVILTGAIPDQAVARQLIQDVTRLVHAYATSGPGW